MRKHEVAGARTGKKDSVLEWDHIPDAVIVGDAFIFVKTAIAS